MSVERSSSGDTYSVHALDFSPGTSPSFMIQEILHHEGSDGLARCAELLEGRVPEEMMPRVEMLQGFVTHYLFRTLDSFRGWGDAVFYVYILAPTISDFLYGRIDPPNIWGFVRVAREHAARHPEIFGRQDAA